MISFEDLRKKQQSGAINSMVISLLSSSLDKAAEGLEAGGDAELAAQARGFAQAFSSLLNNTMKRSKGSRPSLKGEEMRRGAITTR